MSTLPVWIWDTTGNRRQEEELPTDVPVERWLGHLVSRLGLPLQDPAGCPLTYQLFHVRTAEQGPIPRGETLESLGVNKGDIFRLVPEASARARPTASVEETGAPVGQRLRRIEQDLEQTNPKLDVILRMLESSPRQWASKVEGSVVLTPEVLTWARQRFSPQEFVAGIREVQETGGLELGDFIHKLEQEVGSNH
jgi:hypothetical protein